MTNNEVLPAGTRVLHLGYLATVITGNAPDDFAEASTVVNIKYDIPLRGHSIQKDVPASECLLAVEDSFEGDGPSVPILTENGDYDPYAIADGTARPMTAPHICIEQPCSVCGQDDNQDANDAAIVAHETSEVYWGKEYDLKHEQQMGRAYTPEYGSQW